MCLEPDGEDWTRNELQSENADDKSNQNNDQRFASCVDAHSHTDTNARGAFNMATYPPTRQPRALGPRSLRCARSRLAPLPFVLGVAWRKETPSAAVNKFIAAARRAT